MTIPSRAALAALAFVAPAFADDAPPAAPAAGIVEVTGGRPSSLPPHLPTTIEGLTGAEIATRVNATDAEDALKYLPSLLVRKRYVGDYNHAVLSSRASGTGNSARSMVFADGILLSNYLGNGATFAPRWGLVLPEEVERVDVLYGPFSAAYPGNSVGAVVDYVTRLPTRFEAHARVAAFTQPFSLGAGDGSYRGWQSSASIGSRAGDTAWWLSLARTDSQGQPVTFPNRLRSQAVAGASGVPVTGAVAGRNPAGAEWWLLGDATQYDTVQDSARLKLAHDFGGGLRLTWLGALWRNVSHGDSRSWLRDAAGQPVYGGNVSIDGATYRLAATDFNQTRETLLHRMQGLTLQRRDGGAFDWRLAASSYDYGRDLQRTPTSAKPAADDGGAGRVTDLGGTGWDTLAFDAVWRPGGAHQIEFGLQQAQYRWRQAVVGLADWRDDDAGTLQNAFRGNTRLRSAYLQDAWTLAPDWKALVGGRFEHWQAWGGEKIDAQGRRARFGDRAEDFVSPKAAVGWQRTPDHVLRLATGRAVRMPTVGELFQGLPGDSPAVNDPSLKPERSWTTELSSTWTLGLHRLRVSLFHEDTRDALYAFALPNVVPVTSATQNVGRIRTTGLETVFEGVDLGAAWGLKGLDLNASLTYADSEIVENDGLPASVGKQQPRVPRWRASLLASWRATERLTASFGARYGSRQYGTLDNSDRNGFTYMGFSRYFTTDLRLHLAIDKRWSAAFGIDNLNDARYWNFHPYPQRTYSAELRYDL